MVLPVHRLLSEIALGLQKTYNGSALEPSINEMLKTLQEYKVKASRQRVYFAATILDPRFRFDFFIEHEEDARVAEIRTGFQQDAEEFVEGGAVDAPSSPDTSSDLRLRMFKRPRRNSSVADEIREYFSGSLEGEMTDPLQWWKSHAGEFPTLSRMARAYLLIPATSVPSEQLFSVGRQIVSDYRASLSPKHIEVLMVMEDWIAKKLV